MQRLLTQMKNEPEEFINIFEEIGECTEDVENEHQSDKQVTKNPKVQKKNPFSHRRALVKRFKVSSF